MFRFVPYRYLRRHGPVFAAVTSSLLFGLLHMNFLQCAFATCLGTALCFLYERFGKLRYAILLHLLNNSLLLLLVGLPLSQQGKMLLQCVFGAVAAVGLGGWGWMKKEAIQKRAAQLRDVYTHYRAFFLSLPVAVFCIVCLGACVAAILLQ